MSPLNITQPWSVYGLYSQNGTGSYQALMKFPSEKFWSRLRLFQGAQLLGRAGLTLCSEDSDPAAAVKFFRCLKMGLLCLLNSIFQCGVFSGNHPFFSPVDWASRFWGTSQPCLMITCWVSPIYPSIPNSVDPQWSLSLHIPWLSHYSHLLSHDPYKTIWNHGSL